MYKIAILGCENSHANNFLKLIKQGFYPDIQVLGVFSEETAAAEKLREDFGVNVMSDYAELRGKLDGIMITARHGDNHYKYAKPYIEDGIPMFIDKPITCSEEEAVEFMRVVREKGIQLCGGSTCVALKETLELAEAVRTGALGELRGGSLACPIQLNSEYGGFYFYAQHLVEVMMTVFGTNVKAVYADRRENTVTFTAYYDNVNITATYIEKANYYSVSVYGSKKARTELLTFNSESFKHEMNDMQALLEGKKMKKSYEEFITPVFIMNALIRSMENGKREEINQIKI